MYKYNVKILNLKKRKKKYINLHLDIESKKVMRRNKAEIQSEIIRQMKKYKFGKLNTKIAVEIVVYTSHKNPPSIARFTKNILDIMHKKEFLLNKKNDVFLPFEEDRDIKYLSAKYKFLPGESSVIIKIRPFSSFISDLHFIDNEIKDDDNNNEDSFLSIKERHSRLLNDKDKMIKMFSKDAYDSMLDMSIVDMQKSITSSMSINTNIIRLIYPKNNKYTKQVNAIYKKWANRIIKFPIRIQLPEIPTDNDTSKLYKAKIKEQLNKCLEERSIFKPLKSPTVVSVFYSPPQKRIFTWILII